MRRERARGAMGWLVGGLTLVAMAGFPAVSGMVPGSGGLPPGAGALLAQGTMADYERARSVNQRLSGVRGVMAGSPNWIEESNRFWYRRTVEGGQRFILVDAEAGEQGPAFDHAHVAEALSAATGRSFGPDELPFNSFSFAAEGRAIRVTVQGTLWHCSLEAPTCAQFTPFERAPGERGAPGDADDADDADDPASDRPDPPNDVRASPDGEWWAFIHNSNVALRRAGEDDFEMLSWDGSEGNFYTLNSIRWAPDSRAFAAYRRVPGYDRQIPFIEAAPEGQLQPRHWTRFYRKPGDVVDRDRPVIFNLELGERFEVDDALFPNAYNLQRPRWHEDSRGFVFGYNERGHQRYRLIEVDPATGEARALIEERSETFIHYSGYLDVRYVDDGREILWTSERDGWNHIYLYDGVTGELKNQVTAGEWVMREIVDVDEEARRIRFRASGVNPYQDPYFIHYYEVGFDGRGMRALTESDGTHRLHWSPDESYYVARWSRVDQPEVAELRRASDGGLVMELERGNFDAMLEEGWSPVEPFVARGRDGQTDIWGVIVRPTNFDPDRRYPVIENIYAGPHDAFVPKSFTTGGGMLALAELGFIVVQIDGMGTSHRGKAFHDHAWQNVGDAGFPDRILWHEAVAERYDWYDISRVGIYGTSAGGQSSTGALLFHPDFYHVAVSFVGCHDNRMDKIWWNEAWMGWPLGPHYEASSNVANAHRLEGRLLLMVGELDTNVDPQSTIQVADALIAAGKDFDLLFMPGVGHSSGGQYGTRRRNDFFVRHLLGVEPPDWNRVGVADESDGSAWLPGPGSGVGDGLGVGAVAGAGAGDGVASGVGPGPAPPHVADAWMVVPSAEADPQVFDPHAW